MNPLATIWLKPRQTFEDFIEKKKDHPIFVIPIILLGIMMGIDLSTDLIFLMVNRWVSLMIGICLGIGVSFFNFAFFMPGLIKICGKLWKGQATMRQLVNVCAIAHIPFSLVLIQQIALLLIGQSGAIEQVNPGVSNVIWLWSISLLIIGVAKVQRFSSGMALLNIFISALPIILLGLIVSA